MSNADIALLISGVSLAISLAGFVWNIFKEFIYVKPKLAVAFAVYQIIRPGRSTPREVLGIAVTNMGPGPAIIHSCIIRFWRGWIRRRGYALINPLIDPEGTTTQGFFTGLPVELQPGHSKTFHFQYAKDCFLNRGQTITRVGVHDTYGRYHWASRRAVKRAQASYDRDFPPDTPPTAVKS